MTALLCGSRFGRGLVRPGGVLFDLDDARASRACSTASRPRGADVTTAVELALEDPLRPRALRGDRHGLRARRPCALGLVGVAARACGLERDARYEFPSGIYRFAHIPVSTWHTGDVFARAYVRWLEIQRSIDFIRNQFAALPDGEPLRRPSHASRPVPSSSPSSKAGAARSATSPSPTTPAASPTTRSSTPPSTTGWASPWRFATRKSPTSRSATRASTSPIAGMTCKGAGDDQGAYRACERRSIAPSTWPAVEAGHARPLPRPSRHRLVQVPPTAAARCVDACPTGAICAATAATPRRRPRQVPLLRRLQAAACPSGAFSFTTDYRLAARTREDSSSPAATPSSPPPSMKRSAASSAAPSSSARSAPAAATPAKPTSTSSPPSASTSAASASSSSPPPATPTASSSPAPSAPTCASPSKRPTTPSPPPRSSSPSAPAPSPAAPTPATPEVHNGVRRHPPRRPLHPRLPAPPPHHPRRPPPPPRPPRRPSPESRNPWGGQ